MRRRIGSVEHDITLHGHLRWYAFLSAVGSVAMERFTVQERPISSFLDLLLKGDALLSILKFRPKRSRDRFCTFDKPVGRGP